MKINMFFHHVGKDGAQEDFPKTVFDSVPIEIVEQNVTKDILVAYDILGKLEQEFPSGEFNCWGVPAGAQSVIRNLKTDDSVLLVETTSGAGKIPALGIVKAYWNIELRDLSEALWGSHKYPIIFFFDTELMDLTWQEFILQIGYKENFQPRGHFYMINNERFKPYGSALEYVEFLQAKYRIASTKIIKDQGIGYHSNIFEEIDEFVSLNNSLSDTEKETLILSRIGQGVFREGLIRYWGGCAVTGCELVDVLRASHIKPWKNSTNAERLNIYNGLLLLPNLDIVFELGLISFDKQGNILLSSEVDSESLKELGISKQMTIGKLKEDHNEYLQYHRHNIFKG